jgi:hypothetical protein
MRLLCGHRDFAASALCFSPMGKPVTWIYKLQVAGFPHRKRLQEGHLTSQHCGLTWFNLRLRPNILISPMYYGYLWPIVGMGFKHQRNRNGIHLNSTKNKAKNQLGSVRRVVAGLCINSEACSWK